MRAVVVAWALGAGALGAQEDTTRAARAAPPPLFTRGELAWTAAGVAASVGLMQFDTRIQRWITDDAQQPQSLEGWVDGIAKVNEKSLFGAGVLLWGIGRLTEAETLADVSWHAAEAVAITTVTTQVVRVGLGRSRPFVRLPNRDAFDFYPFRGTTNLAYRAFPSIHSAAAFATATVLTAETQRRRPGLVKVVAPTTYALAFLPGLARMHGDKHWASDVLLGAVWGTAVGIATVRWHHTRDDRLDRWMLGVAQAPNGDPMVRVGLAGVPR